ncbi:MAG TPA: macro domain-containing protein [Candidatus Elarobacter sp.]|jgi:O-acetyl-ADP-ribose deacetylase (regulator of RNase III)|nr:macro domain-containing protein [Candidatus Elarobacter sp.]
MLTFKKGDILGADAEALVNTVNCVGIMGRGVALQFKNAFPENFKAYAKACKAKDVVPGSMFVFETHALANPKYIINFPTKRHWRGKSRLEDIDSGLTALVDEVRSRKIRSVAIPPLGAGLGGLEWSEVRPRIERAFSHFGDVDVMVYEPSAGAPPSFAKPYAVPKMTPGRAALVILVQRYLSGLLDPTVSLLEVHKLMYFMQEAGEPLELRYVKAPHGPYAENLRHVLHAIEGYFISGYADGGDSPNKEVRIVPGAVADAESLVRENQATRQRLTRVGELVAGYESPFGLELLATVHWVMTRERARTAAEIADAVYAWGENKRHFSSRQILMASEKLRSNAWISESAP